MIRTELLPLFLSTTKKSLIGEIRLNNKKYKAMKTKTISF